ncbi:uncharacterized protein LOC115966927 [Quercus lobata]|uniref:uncharacterized protein LOC115966927 n=1 Tax=Quercus lobata TaxID=97700 RepID=UPI001245D50D|nr:uncharacterized protein LOC115966927 [Quercus lobata]
MVAWCLWQRRNRLREHQHTWQLHEIGNKAKELVQEFWDVHHKEPQVLDQQPHVRWSLPPVISYKANFDAALFEGTNQVGIGVVFRDHARNVMAALSQRVDSIKLVEVAKSLTARRAVVFARELSLFEVIIEGDYLCLIQALQGSGRCNTLFGHITNETKRLGGLLRHCHFQHVQQEGNRLAHGLARRAVLAVDTDVWVEDLPSDLDDVFQTDLP